MWRGISLANKCLLLFGAAVVLIVVAALAVAWVRLHSLVQDGQHDAARQLVNAWEDKVRAVAADAAPLGTAVEPGVPEEFAGGQVMLLPAEMVLARFSEDEFVRSAWESLAGDAAAAEYVDAEWTSDAVRVQKYAKAIRGADGSLQGLIVLSNPSEQVARDLVINTIYLFSAGLISLGLAVLVFYLITNRLILSPVRALRETADLVRAGDLSIRSDIETGDEFEDLSETFNQMLEALQGTQDQLRAINRSLDVKLNELEERNVALHEANKLKGEFLASVSHELRTPLNSIIGFAELLMEMVEREFAAGDDSTRNAKRRRYIEHILGAGRSLLEMINGLLEMAKVEAGKIDIRPEAMNLADACESLVAVMRPFADKNGVTLSLELAADLPVIETDQKKFQQIVYNLLSNAIKFTGDAKADASGDGKGRSGRVILRAERLVPRGGPEADERVRVSVLDNGPGIAPEDQRAIFEKFRQLDSGLTRRHAGTGLGLAISKELAMLLQGEIIVESELGRGSMFSLILPLKLDLALAQEHRLEMAFRGSLSGRAAAAARHGDDGERAQPPTVSAEPA